MNPADAEADFIQRVVVLGGTVLGKYISSNAPVFVRCSAGHDCYPYPSNVRRGQGICRLCKGKVWDVFYLMGGTHSFKLGITSGDPEGRIRDHRPYGYTEPVVLFARLPGTVAKDLEDKLKRDMPISWYPPVERDEIFNNDALKLALYIIADEMIEYRSYCVIGAELLWPGINLGRSIVEVLQEAPCHVRARTGGKLRSPAVTHGRREQLPSRYQAPRSQPYAAAVITDAPVQCLLSPAGLRHRRGVLKV